MNTEHLRHGKLLAKKTFPTFVETFNQTVDRMTNLKGDADIGEPDGKITVDNTDVNHPVIRFVGDLSTVHASGQSLNVDTMVPECQTSSIAVISSEVGNTLRVQGFDGQEALDADDVKQHVEDYDVLVRRKNDDEYDMQYVNISSMLSGSTASGGLRQVKGNWDWPTGYLSVDSEGNPIGSVTYLPPGHLSAKITGYYMFGYYMTYYSGLIPEQPAGTYYLCLSGSFNTAGSRYPANVSCVWTQYYPTTTLSTWGFPLYVRNMNKLSDYSDVGPTYDFKAGMFVIPAYYWNP